MSRALVLGGGGPVGIGWEAGLVVGLADAGIGLARADLVLGTSAGSVVGAQLALGRDLDDIVTQVSAPLPSTEPAATGPAGAGGMEALMAAMVEAASGSSSPEDTRLALGRLAVSAPTFDEELFVGVFGQLVGATWPDAFACTAVDVETGEPKLWNRHAGAPLERAVASSCSVPAIFPPITIGGRRYMDGGMRTALNADLAIGHDIVVAVSCFALSLPPGMSDPLADALNAALETEFATLRAAGAALEVIAPGDEFLDISGWGLHLMDPGRAGIAYDAGARQAAVEAERIRTVWGA